MFDELVFSIYSLLFILSSIFFSYYIRNRVFLIKVPELFFIINYSVLILAYFSKYTGFISLEHDTAILLYFLVFSFQLLLNLVDKKISLKGQLNLYSIINRFDRVMAIFLICYFTYTFYSLLSSHEMIFLFSDVIREGFGNAYLTYFTIFFTTYFICYASKMTDIFISIILIFIIFLMGVKGIVLIPMVSYLIFYSINSVKGITIKLLGIAIVSVFCLFFLIYMIPFIFIENINTSDSVKLIGEKIIRYLVGGILAFNYDFSNQQEQINALKSLFSPFYNFFSDANDKASYMINTLTPIKTDNNIYTNVKTFWGTIYINSKDFYPFVIIFFYILNGLFYYLIYCFRSNMKYTTISLIMFISVMFFSWFEYYYWHSFLYYGVIYGIVLDLLYFLVSSCRRRNKCI